MISPFLHTLQVSLNSTNAFESTIMDDTARSDMIKACPHSGFRPPPCEGCMRKRCARAIYKACEKRNDLLRGTDESRPFILQRLSSRETSTLYIFYD